jgi:hypothetical protein
MTIFRRLIAVAYFVEVGLLLLVVPWSGYLQNNYFVSAWPWLRPVVGNPYVAGMISGLGVLNLGAGLLELVGLFARRHEEPESPDDPYGGASWPPPRAGE